MAVVLYNKRINENIFELKVKGCDKGEAGQFFMVRCAGIFETFLPRPISIHDREHDEITFLYQLKGKGTSLLSQFKEGEEIQIDGPYGNGFSFTSEDSVFVGGGIGIAPLYYAIKQFKRLYPEKKAKAYFGFSDEAYKMHDYEKIADEVTLDIGGFITDKVEEDAKIYYACGAEAMMRKLYEKLKDKDNKIYVSLESHMACGVGACLGCSVKTINGMRRVCKDGTVFEAREVFYE